MRLFSYVVVRDYGFAPNPFHGLCTLATCKPEIRNAAGVGDWVAGFGSADRSIAGGQYAGRLIYAMKVSEVLSFDAYWNDPRFLRKRPYLPGSTKLRYGDNIYHRDTSGAWVQEESHHSFAGGDINRENLVRDTSSDYVLIASEFYYFGKSCPLVPNEFDDIRRSRRGHKCSFPPPLIEAFITWLQNSFPPGCRGLSIDW